MGKFVCWNISACFIRSKKLFNSLKLTLGGTMHIGEMSEVGMSNLGNVDELMFKMLKRLNVELMKRRKEKMP